MPPLMLAREGEACDFGLEQNNSGRLFHGFFPWQKPSRYISGLSVITNRIVSSRLHLIGLGNYRCGCYI